MNKTSKKTVFGITTAAAAAAALAVGMAGPAMASTGHDGLLTASGHRGSSSTESTLTQSQWDALRTVTTGVTGGNASNTSPVVVSPGLNVGDVASGNAVGSGDPVGAIGSGNDGALLSGNSSDAALLSGNTTTAANNDGNLSGNSITSDVQKLVKNATSGSANSSKSTSSSSTSSTSANASDIVGNVLSGLGLGN